MAPEIELMKPSWRGDFILMKVARYLFPRCGWHGKETTSNQYRICPDILLVGNSVHEYFDINTCMRVIFATSSHARRPKLLCRLLVAPMAAYFIWYLY